MSNILVVNAPLKLHSVDCTHVEMCRFKATHVEVVTGGDLGRETKGTGKLT